jgi:hypothetical protein
VGHLKRFAKGCAYGIASLIFWVFIIQFLYQSWPFWIYLILVVIGYAATYEFESSFAKAANGILGPVAIGLLVLCLMLLIFNAIPGDQHTIGFMERLIIRLDKNLPAWTKLSWPSTAAILIALMVLSYLKAGAGHVTRFLKLKKTVGKLTAAVGTLACFSFFTNAYLVEPNTKPIYKKLTAIYVGAKKREEDKIGEYLALISAERAIKLLNNQDKEYQREFLESLRAISKTQAVAEAVGDFVGDKWSAQAGKINIPPALPAVEPDFDAAKSIAPLEAVDVQVAKANKTEAFVGQMKKGVSELLSQTLGLGVDPLKDKVVDTLTDRLGGQFKDAAKKFLDKTLDKKIDKLTEPYIEEATNKILAALRIDTKKPGSPPSAKSAAAETIIDALEAKAKESFKESEQISQLAKNAEYSANKGDVDLAEKTLAESDARLKNASAKIESLELNVMDANKITQITDGLEAATITDQARRTEKILSAAKAANAAHQSLRNTKIVYQAAKVSYDAAKVIKRGRTIIKIIDIVRKIPGVPG